MTPDEINRRAGGRRGDNRRRQWLKECRQWDLGRLARSMGLNLFMRGTAAALARQLGVHRSTVSRDIQDILWELSHGKHAEVYCPCCSTLVKRDRLHFPHNLAKILGIELPPDPDELEEPGGPDDDPGEPLAQAG